MQRVEGKSLSSFEEDTHQAPVLPVTRILAQALSNIITDNNETASLLWEDYMATSHDGNILLSAFPQIIYAIRLIAS
jgi:hypothetical protein